MIRDIWNDVEREVREMYEAYVKKRGCTITEVKRATVRSLKQDKRRQRHPEEYLTEEEIAEVWAYNRLNRDPDDPDAHIYLECLRPLKKLK